MAAPTAAAVNPIVAATSDILATPGRLMLLPRALIWPISFFEGHALCLWCLARKRLKISLYVALRICF